MARAETNLQDFKTYETLPYHKTFCPFQSSKLIPVPCEKECACFTVQFDFGKVIFAGCSLKWVALCSH